MKYNYLVRQAPVWSLVLFITIGLGTGKLNAQDINHPTSGTVNETVTCGTSINYYDSGGPFSTYSINESGTINFCPGTPGEAVTISFSSVDIETRSSSPGCWDFLTITDANGTLVNGCGETSGDGTQAGTGADQIDPGDSFTSSAANGCLTVSFNSDGSVSEGGWVANVSCSGGAPPSTCGSGEAELNETYCYGNNDNTGFNYESADGSNPMTLTFTAGGIESNFDLITIYDGPGDNSPVLFSGDNGGDLSGLSVTSTGTELYMEVDSDGSVSCTSESGCCLTSWAWTVCNGSIAEPPPPSVCNDNEVVVDMADSFGDGWNGNVLEIIDENNNIVASATITSGSSGSASFCLPDGCYIVMVDGGSFDSEVGWTISVNGNVVLSGGAPESGLGLDINGSCGGGVVNCEDNALSLELNFDQFSSETSWNILDDGGNEVAAGSGYSGLGNESLTEDICLPDGCYDLNVFDSFDDGMCCSFGNGGYTLFDVDDNVLASGGEFGASETTSFCLGVTPCDIAITGSSSTPETCPGDSDGTISVSASCSSCASIEYSVGAGFQPSGTFSGLAAGNYTVTARDTGDPSCVATTTISVGAGTGGAVLPPWTTTDVGTPGVNTYGQNPCAGGGTFSISSGANNGNPMMDGVGFIGQTICGNGEITAKIESVDAFGYGGLMIRESASPMAKQYALFSNLTNILLTNVRTMTGAPKVTQLHSRPFPVWLKLSRMGNTIFSYWSNNGVNYNILQVATVPMNTCVEIGMAAFTTTAGPKTAVFSNVSLSGGIPLLEEIPGSNAFNSTIQAEPATLFPNPAQDLVTVDFGSGVEVETQMVLRNKLGQQVRQLFVEPGLYRQELNVGDLTSGMYIIELHREGQPVEVLRFIKQ
jgi:regulation of enolase protein 1 (concanavalin A-like superfamily)